MCDRDGFKRRGLTERSWRQWEAGDRPSRDYEDLLCRLFDTGPVQLGFAADYTRRVVVRERDLELPRPRIPMALPPLKGAGGHPSSVLAFGHSFQTEAEVIMSAARESAHFTQYAGRTNVGPHTLDQLDADLRNLIKAYPGRPVFPTFLELVDLRNRAFELLEGQQYPKQGRDLYLIAGVTCGVLANASFDLGHMDAAATQARTAYLCAELAGSDWLRTWVRGMQSLIAYWCDHFEEAISLASSVRETVCGQGSAAVRLASIEARAHARVGNAEGVETALAAAANARETADHPDEYGGMRPSPWRSSFSTAAPARCGWGADHGCTGPPGKPPKRFRCSSRPRRANDVSGRCAWPASISLRHVLKRASSMARPSRYTRSSQTPRTGVRTA
jgi:hypothetical protein